MPFLGGIIEQLGQTLDALAAYAPWAKPEPDPEPPGHTGAQTVNGVDLPQLVLDQLRIAGLNPSWCNPFELQAAKREAAVDCDVFDEDDGDNFYDNLTLDHEEIKARDEKMAPGRAPPTPSIVAIDIPALHDSLEALSALPPPTAVIDSSTFCGKLHKERACKTNLDGTVKSSVLDTG